MKLFLIGFALLACTYAEGPSAEYLPPAEASASQVVESNFLESEPAHSLSDDGYRYKTVKRFRLRHRRDVNELSSEYLPPQAGSAPAASYSAPVQSYSAPAQSYSAPVQSYSAPSVSFASAPAASSVSYSAQPSYSPAPAASSVSFAPVQQSFDTSYSAPVQSYSAPVRSYSAPVQSYSAPAQSYSAPSVSFAPAPAASSVSYAAQPSYSPVPAASSVSFAPAQQSFDTSASEPAPAHTLSDDGYRYKTVKRIRYRRRH